MDFVVTWLSFEKVLQWPKYCFIDVFAKNTSDFQKNRLSDHVILLCMCQQYKSQIIRLLYNKIFLSYIKAVLHAVGVSSEICTTQCCLWSAWFMEAMLPFSTPYVSKTMLYQPTKSVTAHYCIEHGRFCDFVLALFFSHKTCLESVLFEQK